MCWSLKLTVVIHLITYGMWFPLPGQRLLTCASDSRQFRNQRWSLSRIYANVHKTVAKLVANNIVTLCSLSNNISLTRGVWTWRNHLREQERKLGEWLRKEIMKLIKKKKKIVNSVTFLFLFRGYLTPVLTMHECISVLIILPTIL